MCDSPIDPVWWRVFIFLIWNYVRLCEYLNDRYIIFFSQVRGIFFNITVSEGGWGELV